MVENSEEESGSPRALPRWPIGVVLRSVKIALSARGEGGNKKRGYGEKKKKAITEGMKIDLSLGNTKQTK